MRFESHLEKLEESAARALLELRNFVRSLGSNVIEEVRPHRLVYAKTLNFRIFLDVEPAGDSLAISIKSGRSAPPVTVTVRTLQELDATKEKIAEAYQTIQ